MNYLVPSFFKIKVEDAILFMNLNCQLKAWLNIISWKWKPVSLHWIEGHPRTLIRAKWIVSESEHIFKYFKFLTTEREYDLVLCAVSVTFSGQWVEKYMFNQHNTPWRSMLVYSTHFVRWKERIKDRGSGRSAET